MKVKDFYQKITRQAALVRENDSVEEVMEKIAGDPKSRTAYVVNEEEELVGIIPIRKILELLGENLLKRHYDFIRASMAKKAKDLVEHPVSVSPDTPAEKALELALNYDLEELPVCDKGKVIGEVNCFEILKALTERG